MHLYVKFKWHIALNININVTKVEIDEITTHQLKCVAHNQTVTFINLPKCVRLLVTMNIYVVSCIILNSIPRIFNNKCS